MFGLSDAGRDADHFDIRIHLLFFGKRVFRREVLQVALYEIRGFVIGIGHLRGCCNCIIPVEVGDLTLLQLQQETFFRNGKGVQSDKNHLRIRQVATVVTFHPFDHFAEDHAFIAFTFGGECTFQVVIQVVQDFPYGKKLFLVGRIPFRIEGRPERADGGNLIFIQEAEIILYLPQIGHIRKEHAGIGHILIYIVEIVKEHFAPVQELVECLRRSAVPYIYIV